MKNKRTKIIVLVATIIVGFLIGTNFSFEDMESNITLDASQYQSAIEEKQKLLKQITSLKDSNEELVERINKYSYDDKKQEKIMSDMKEQLVDYGMLSGLNEVKGPGVVITISDGKFDVYDESKESVMAKILHDSDMASLLNELRGAGAESISINNHRITPLTAVICNFAFLGFDDGDQLYAPFNVYAIGNPDILEESLSQEGSYYNQLKERGLNLKLTKKSEIIMKSANVRSISYAKEYVEK